MDYYAIVGCLVMEIIYRLIIVLNQYVQYVWKHILLSQAPSIYKIKLLKQMTKVYFVGTERYYKKKTNRDCQLLVI